MILERIDEMITAARVAESRGDFSTALEIFAHASQLDPSGYESNRRLALALSNSRNLSPFSEELFCKALDQRRDPGLLACLGLILARHGRFEEALAVTSEALSQDGGNVDYAFQILKYLLALGRQEAATELAHELLEIALTQARAENPDDPFLFLWPPEYLYGYIGETTSRLDMFLKARALGLLPAFRPRVIVTEGAPIANRCLFAMFAAHITVEEYPEAEAKALFASHRQQKFEMEAVLFPERGAMPLLVAWQHVNRLWHDQGRKPLLALSEEQRQRGRDSLRKAGMPEGAWFVCLHVRDGSYYREDSDWSLNRFRNADIATYRPAIEAVTARGGWVIRMGDRVGAPLPPMAQVIDYANAGLRTDEDDIILAASCKFFIGTTSGLSQVPVVFGVPVVLVNCFGFTTYPVAPGDRYIHKRARWRESGKELTIAEMFTPPVRNQMSPVFFDEAGIDIIDNTPEEIRDAVLEMDDLLSGNSSCGGADDALWRRYAEAADFSNYGLAGRVASRFLQAELSLA